MYALSGLLLFFLFFSFVFVCLFVCFGVFFAFFLIYKTYNLFIMNALNNTVDKCYLLFLGGIFCKLMFYTSKHSIQFITIIRRLSYLTVHFIFVDWPLYCSGSFQLPELKMIWLIPGIGSDGEFSTTFCPLTEPVPRRTIPVSQSNQNSRKFWQSIIGPRCVSNWPVSLLGTRSSEENGMPGPPNSNP